MRRSALRVPPITTLVIAGALASVACDRDVADRLSGDRGESRGAVDRVANDTGRVAVVDDLDGPESARYDPRRDVYFVSNVNGQPTARDNNGYIARLRGDGSVDSLRFIAGGRAGVTLHAPKGMTLTGDTLWVADIDVVRAFDIRTGARVLEVDLRGRARMLNDIAVGPDGALYVTDTGVEPGPGGEIAHPGPDQIFRVDRGGRATVAVRDSALNGPNGITWDDRAKRFVVVSFMGDGLHAWTPPRGSVTTIAQGPGRFDGVEVLDDGRILVSSWADSSLLVYTDGRFAPLVEHIPQPADIGVDARRSQVAIPLLGPGRVELWPIPRR